MGDLLDARERERSMDAENSAVPTENSAPDFENGPLNSEDATCEEKVRPIPYGLAVMVAILALVTLVLMLLLIASTQRGTDNANGDDPAVTKSSTVIGTSDEIKVKQVTDYMTENEAAPKTNVSTDGGTSSGSSGGTTSGSTGSTGTSSTIKPGTLDVDEDVAAVLAQTAGYTPLSVYVFTKDAIDSGASSPRSGLVLSTQEYVGRTNGEKFRFLNVQTSDPKSKVRTVPDLNGMAWKAARAKLADSGLGIRYVYEYDSPDTFGNVIFQAPAPGSYMPRGSSVVVVLAN